MTRVRGEPDGAARGLPRQPVRPAPDRPPRIGTLVGSLGDRLATCVVYGQGNA